ncbi:MAG: ABC transporter permease subunit [Alphaproteobacteria bacterium]|jgi:microcin C transport system permease protein|nr:ABC transporter permease subunit [Alphaproteobacteria bacterium]
MKILSKLILLAYFILGVIYFFKDNSSIYQPFLPPSLTHFLGTNSFGKDIFSSLFASILDLFIMMLFGFVSIVFGVFLGSLQGYYRTYYDFILQRLYEIVISIPFFYVIILFSGYFELNIFNLGFLLILFNWTFLIPYIRLQALKISISAYIIQMQDIGYSKRRILFFHVIPNVYYNIKYLIPFVLILFMTSLTSLDFLGFFNQGNMSVGSLIFEGVNYPDFPVILISSCAFMIVLFVALIGLFEVNKYYD